MKRIITLLALSMTVILAHAQSNGTCEWKERMMSEKIAFLTVEMELTPQEAQTFWPVYNTVSQERDAIMKETFEAFKALQEAIDKKTSDKDIEKLLNAYRAAQEKQLETDKAADKEFRKVLDISKVAKLYIAEEKFRRQNIRKLRGGHGQHHPDHGKPQK